MIEQDLVCLEFDFCGGHKFVPVLECLALSFKDLVSDFVIKVPIFLALVSYNEGRRPKIEHSEWLKKRI